MTPAQIDKEAEAAKAAFLKALNEFNPTEIHWALGRLADHAKDRIKELEEEIIRHERFKRPDKVQECQRNMGYYERLIKLRDLWREADMKHSAPGIVAAIMGRNKGNKA